MKSENTLFFISDYLANKLGPYMIFNVYIFCVWTSRKGEVGILPLVVIHVDLILKVEVAARAIFATLAC